MCNKGRLTVGFSEGEIVGEGVMLLGDEVGCSTGVVVGLLVMHLLSLATFSGIVCALHSFEYVTWSHPHTGS